MATATMAQPKGRRSTRARGVRIFKWSTLSPLILLFLFLMPVFLLQIYFSFHSWTV